MGLAIVEVIMAVEEEFGIRIEDDDASGLRTIDDMYQLVLAKLGCREPLAVVCATSHEFYRTRRAVMERLWIPRSRIAPRRRWEDLLPPDRRADDWQTLSGALEAPLPPLEAPPWLGRLLGWGFLAACAWRFLGFSTHAVPHPLLPAAAWVALAVVSGLPWIPRRHVPERCATVGDLARYLISHRVPVLAAAGPAPSVPEPSPAPCATSAAFYRARRALVGLFGVSRRAVRPAAALDNLVPRGERGAHWQALARAVGEPLPPLQPSPSLDAGIKVGCALVLFPALVFLTFAYFAAAHASSFLEAAAWVVVLGATFAGVISAPVMAEGMAPRNRIPASCATVGVLARYIAGGRCTGAAAALPEGAPGTVEVWERLRSVIADQIRAKPDEVTRDCTLADLNLD